MGAVLCVITPLLPVSVTQASFDWPQHSVSAEAPTPSVTAPLIAQTAESLDVTIDCAVLRGLPAAGGVVLATMPTTAPDSKAKALYVTASRDAVSVTFRNVAAASIPRAELAACARLHAFSSATATGAQFVGPGGARVGNAAGDLGADARPQIDGMFTDLSTAQVLAAGSGVRAHVQIDNRYESTPSVLKLLVMILAVLCVVVSLGALFWLDRLGGYRRRVGARTRWARRLRPSPIDLVVTAVLGVWTLLVRGHQTTVTS